MTSVYTSAAFAVKPRDDRARQIEALAVAAGKLPPIQRALIRLVYLEAKPMTIAQAAAHIGIAERTATRRMRQAVATLRGKLGATDGAM